VRRVLPPFRLLRRTPGGVWAWVVVRLRWLVLAGWIAATVWVVLNLPTIEQAQLGALGDLVPRDAAALQAEIESATRFDVPVLAHLAVVQRNPQGLSEARQRAAVALAVRVSRRQEPGLRALGGAFTLVNARGVPGAREQGTTTITYLFFSPDVDEDEQVKLATAFADRLRAAPGEARVGVTGALPARLAQFELIQDRLPWVELATIALVALAVGLHFRAPGPALLTLGTVAVAYLIAVRLVAYLGRELGVSVPSEVQPVIVVLLFGVITDYCIFLVARFRRARLEGARTKDAAEAAAAEVAGVVMTAGLAVVVAALALIVARVDFLRAFGPGLAMSVLVAAVVAASLVPAALAVLGRPLLWPARGESRAVAAVAAPGGRPRDVRGPRSWLVRTAARAPVLVALAVVAGLVFLASAVTQLAPANPLARALPRSSPVEQAAADAARGFEPGLLAPSVMLVEQPGLGGRLEALARLQAEVARVPGVAQVLGPGTPLLGRQPGVMVSREGGLARLLVVLDADPLSGRAIDTLGRLRGEAPQLLERAGLPAARVAFAGDTALAAETISRTAADMLRVAPLALLGLLLVLGLYLRAVVAPALLVASSALGVAAALGLGTLVVQEELGYGDMTYYVPFAAAVLLVSLGSDYNVFLAARIWQEMPRRGVREAVVVGGTRAAPSIAAASIVLAGSFALLAIVPIRPFRELAVVMGLGLLLDAFVVRTVLVPALVALVGRRSTWPRKAPAPEPEPPRPLPAA
jgi:RND superfamily putative drug exporter